MKVKIREYRMGYWYRCANLIYSPQHPYQFELLKKQIAMASNARSTKKFARAKTSFQEMSDHGESKSLHWVIYKKTTPIQAGGKGIDNKMNSRLTNLKVHLQRDASRRSSNSLRNPGSQLIMALCSLFNMPRCINLDQKTVQLFWKQGLSVILLDCGKMLFN